MKNLDSYIMGINDPHAPFNQDPALLACECGYTNNIKEFQFTEDDNLFLCPICDRVWHEEIFIDYSRSKQKE